MTKPGSGQGLLADLQPPHLLLLIPKCLCCLPVCRCLLCDCMIDVQT